MSGLQMMRSDAMILWESEKNEMVKSIINKDCVWFCIESIFQAIFLGFNFSTLPEEADAEKLLAVDIRHPRLFIAVR